VVVGLVLATAALAVPLYSSARSAVLRGDLLQNGAPLERALADYWREHGRFPASSGAVNPPWDFAAGSPRAPGRPAQLVWDEEPWRELGRAAPATTPTRVRFAYFSTGEGSDASAWLYAVHDFEGGAKGWDRLGWDCTHLWIASTGPVGTYSVAAERRAWRGDE
jgi:hypothetical protein